jgi:hypothetical protein
MKYRIRENVRRCRSAGIDRRWGRRWPYLLDAAGAAWHRNPSGPSAAIIPDGSAEPHAIDDIRLYEPSTRPDSPLPHAWIDDESGNRRPLKDLVVPVDAARAAAFTGRFILLSGMGSEFPSFTGRLLNAIKGDLQGNQRDRDEYLRNSGLDWSIGRGAILTKGAGGTAAICISPPVHRLSLLRRLARADFARALIAAAEAPAASRRMFDVFNEPGSPPTDEALARQFACPRRARGAEQISQSAEKVVAEQCRA